MGTNGIMTFRTNNAYSAVLAFGCLETTSGEGLQSDVLTLASMGCHPLSVACAVAVRDTRGVDEVSVLDAEVIVAQAQVILEDVPVAAFRVGMLGSVENVAAVAALLSDYPETPLVLEPSLALIDFLDEDGEEYCQALMQLLLPMASVLVVGQRDLERLVVEGSSDQDDVEGGIDQTAALEAVFAAGVGHVLLCGGDSPGDEIENVLYVNGTPLRSDRWRRLAGHYLGARALLATAIAASLAQGMDVARACREAEEFVFQALSSAYRIGMGLALPDRLFWTREDAGRED